MTIITGKEFRASQGKYIDMARNGERVILSSRNGYTELTPVSINDKEIREHAQSKAFLAIAKKARREFLNGETLGFNSAAEAQRWMDELSPS